MLTNLLYLYLHLWIGNTKGEQIVVEAPNTDVTVSRGKRSGFFRLPLLTPILKNVIPLVVILIPLLIYVLRW